METNKNSNLVLAVMDELIRTIQQLQKLAMAQISNTNVIAQDQSLVVKPSVEKQSQTAVLLLEVQHAMESVLNQQTDCNKTVSLSISEKWRQYAELIQAKEKQNSTIEYCKEKMKLGQQLGLSFNETKREMLIGLWSERLADVLYLKEHNSNEDILKDIYEWERIQKARIQVYKK